MRVEIPTFDTAFARTGGYPHPDWGTIYGWVDANVDSAARQEVVCELERRWLARLAAHLGGGYRVAESAQFLLLHDPAATDADAFLRMAEETLALVEDSLEEAADGPETHGKVPVIVFPEDDDFYDYISHFFPHGHYGLLGGVCIREGDVHLALRCSEEWVRRTFSHELTHACLAHLELPSWLEEGVAEVIARRVVDEEPIHFDSLARERHYAFWSWHGLTSLWTGSAFGRPDDLGHLAYELSEALVRWINAEDQRRFNQFLLAAKCDDGGEAAARQCLGRSLVAYVAPLLGEGPWLPPAGLPPGALPPTASWVSHPCPIARRGNARGQATV